LPDGDDVVQAHVPGGGVVGDWLVAVGLGLVEVGLGLGAADVVVGLALGDGARSPTWPSHCTGTVPAGHVGGLVTLTRVRVCLSVRQA
jgi:hypothetical protein